MERHLLAGLLLHQTCTVAKYITLYPDNTLSDFFPKEVFVLTVMMMKSFYFGAGYFCNVSAEKKKKKVQRIIILHAYLNIGYTRFLCRECSQNNRECISWSIIISKKKKHCTVTPFSLFLYSVGISIFTVAYFKKFVKKKLPRLRLPSLKTSKRKKEK